MTQPRSIGTSLALLGALLASGCDSHDDHEGHDHAGEKEKEEHEEGEVHLTEAQFKSAGIEVRAAGPGTVESYLILTAVVEANRDTQAHVTPKIGGLVRAIHKRLGDRVKQGDLICEIDSVELGKSVSGYLSARTRLAASRARLTKETALLRRSVTIAQTVFDREEKLKAKEITTLRPYYAAEKALAEAKLEKDRRLLNLQSSVQEREIEVHSAEEQLRILGLGAKEIQGLRHDDTKSHGRYRIRAPRAGVVVARHITENEFVDTSSKLFRVVDLSQVWVLASVYERDLRRVRKGQKVAVSLDAFPGVSLPGAVEFVDFHVDPKTRACRARVVLPNKPIPGWKAEFPIRPGMFGTVRVVVAQHQAPVVIPEAAIVHEGEQNFVFVQEEQEERAYVRRVVQLGVRARDVVEVKSGLKAGEAVVVKGTFTLKSLARQGELGGGHSH